MADPFSLLSAAAGLTDVSIRASLKLRTLISDFKNAPALILDLSNQITEISLVLERVKESRQAVETLGDAQHDAGFLACLGGELDKAGGILIELESLAARLSPGKPANQGFRWLRQKKHAVKLNNRLKEVRQRINDLLVAHNPSLESRIKLELHEVKVGMQQAQATSGELGNIRTAMARQETRIGAEIQTLHDSFSVRETENASHKREVNKQLSTIHNTIHTGSQVINRIATEQAYQFQATQSIQTTILTELARMRTASVKRSRTAIQPPPSRDDPSSVLSFSMRLRGSQCGNGCQCRCHLPAQPGISLQIPPMLRIAIGYLFLGYTGYPSASAGCNDSSCAKGKYLRLQIVYRFPFWWCLHYAMYAWVEASTSGIFTFTMAARRRMPFRPGHIPYEAQIGSTKNLEQLIQHERGCVQDVYYFDGRPALTLAFNDRNPDGINNIKLLLQNGADPDQVDDYGLSPRLCAGLGILAKRYSPDFTRALESLFPISSCIEVLELSYMHKIVLGLLPIRLETALQNPVPDLLNAKDRVGRTPLTYAAANSDVATVCALIDAGADVNMVDDMGFSALHRVILSSKAEGSLVSANALVQAGADINAIITQDGLSCLHLAADRNRVDIGRRLIDAGANVHIINPFTHETPLLRAGHYNSVGMVRCLYDAGASLESPNGDGETPIIAAASGDAEAALVLLLRLGADTDHVDKQKRTLLHHMATSASLEMMRNLTDANADINIKGQDAMARDQNGRTAQQVLELRQPGPELREVFARLVRQWSSTTGDANDDDEDASSEEDCFYDAIE
ncbi:hypothetical protein F5Y12DRAFT_553733 [Xylaria sp. FL1777]|nr:hypothetical protein F5Y12DRAFT_553733 [Xylaria sp. FL1777]